MKYLGAYDPSIIDSFEKEFCSSYEKKIINFLIRNKVGIHNGIYNGVIYLRFHPAWYDRKDGIEENLAFNQKSNPWIFEGGLRVNDDLNETYKEIAQTACKLWFKMNIKDSFCGKTSLNDLEQIMNERNKLTLT